MKNSLVREKVVLFRVVGKMGEIVADLLPEDQARGFVDFWNRNDIGGKSPVRLAKLTVAVLKQEVIQ